MAARGSDIGLNDVWQFRHFPSLSLFLTLLVQVKVTCLVRTGTQKVNLAAKRSVREK